MVLRCVIKSSLSLIGLLLVVTSEAQIAFADMSYDVGAPYGRYRCVAAYDYDGDGRDDLFFGGQSGGYKLLRNLGDWQFEDVSETLQPLAPSNNYGGAVFADLDDDGYVELVLGGRGTPARLMSFGPDGWRDATPGSGVYTSGRTLSLNLADLNGDGLTDIYIALLNEANKLYINQGNLVFTEEAEARGAEDDNISMGAIATDFDKDGDVDLYLTHDSNRPNLLLRNDGTGHFTNVAAARNADIAANGMGVDVADFDGDLQPDIYITNLLENNLLLSGNRYPPTYTDAAGAMGIDDRGMGWGVNVFDVDLDGRLDIYVANQTYFTVDGRERANLLYVQQDDSTFVDAAEGAELSPFNDFGSATADFDNDGDLDIAIATSGGAGCQVFRNDSERRGRSLTIRTPLINAQATLSVDGGRVWDETHAGSGFAAQSAAMWHFGLGDADAIDSMVVRTVQGDRFVLRGLEPDKAYTLSGAGVLAEVVVPQSSSTSAVLAGFSLAPNPTAGDVQLVLPKGAWDYTLSDLRGRVLQRGTLGEGTQQLSLRGQASGVYILRLRDIASGEQTVRRILRR